jgi:hypothetical protein
VECVPHFHVSPPWNISIPRLKFLYQLIKSEFQHGITK